MTTHTSESGSIAAFVDRLIEDKNLGKLDIITQNELRSGLYRRVDDLIKAKVVELLPKDQLDAFEALLNEKAESAQLQSFCETHIPELRIAIAETLLQFRNTYLGIAA